jgi:hypothetical protein
MTAPRTREAAGLAPTDPRGFQLMRDQLAGRPLRRTGADWGGERLASKKGARPPRYAETAWQAEGGGI